MFCLEKRHLKQRNISQNQNADEPSQTEPQKFTLENPQMDKAVHSYVFRLSTSKQHAYILGTTDVSGITRSIGSSPFSLAQPSYPSGYLAMRILIVSLALAKLSAIFSTFASRTSRKRIHIAITKVTREQSRTFHVPSTWLLSVLLLRHLSPSSENLGSSYR